MDPTGLFDFTLDTRSLFSLTLNVVSFLLILHFGGFSDTTPCFLFLYRASSGLLRRRRAGLLEIQARIFTNVPPFSRLSCHSCTRAPAHVGVRVAPPPLAAEVGGYAHVVAA